jgi:hypothetical protein
VRYDTKGKQYFNSSLRLCVCCFCVISVLSLCVSGGRCCGVDFIC